MSFVVKVKEVIRVMEYLEILEVRKKKLNLNIVN